MSIKKNQPYSTVFILFLSTILIGGCVSKGKFLAKVNEGDALAQQLQEENQKAAALEKEKNVLKERLNDINRQASLKEKEQSDLIKAQSEQISLLEAQRNQDEAQKNNLENQVTDLGKMLSEAEKMAAKKIRDAQESVRAREELIQNLNKEIQEGHIKISQMNDRLSVQIVSKILFPSGSDQVTGEGKTVLKKVGDTLKNIQENKILIEGHTDNVPIGSGLAGRFPTNWELSTARATQVVRYLAEENVDPNKLVAAGMAEFAPVASNDTPEGRQKNRRIEIILTPK